MTPKCSPKEKKASKQIQDGVKVRTWRRNGRHKLQKAGWSL